jgi:hypothetical protein
MRRAPIPLSMGIRIFLNRSSAEFPDFARKALLHQTVTYFLIRISQLLISYLVGGKCFADSFRTHCTRMVQTVQAYPSACRYAREDLLFHKLFNTYVEKFTRCSQATEAQLLSKSGPCVPKISSSGINRICRFFLTPARSGVKVPRRRALQLFGATELLGQIAAELA